MTRKQVIERFLNDKVESVNYSVYKWHDLTYEVIPYKELLKDKTLKASHFIKFQCGIITYGIRELSCKVFKKRYE